MTRSSNTVYAQLMVRLGPQAVAEVAVKAGVPRDAVTPAERAMGLGALREGVSPLEQAAGFATFDLRIRQAIAHAIDTRAVVNNVLDGNAAPEKTMIPAASLGPHASLVRGLNFDPAGARTLLDQAGYRPGPDGIRVNGDRRLRLRFACCFPSPVGIKPIPEFIRTQLKDVGIELDIVERPDSASYQAIVTARETDIAIEQGNQNDVNPAFLPLLLFHNAAGSSADYVGLYGPGGRFDELMATTLTEPDLDRVRRTTAEAMRIMIDEQAIVVPLAGVIRLYGMKESMDGFQAHPSTINMQWHTMYRTR